VKNRLSYALPLDDVAQGARCTGQKGRRLANVSKSINALIKELPAIGPIKMADPQMRNIGRLRQAAVHGHIAGLGRGSRLPMGNAVAGGTCAKFQPFVTPTVTAQPFCWRLNGDYAFWSMRPQRGKAAADGTVARHQLFGLARIGEGDRAAMARPRDHIAPFLFDALKYRAMWGGAT
jgi:hypothetical protein